MARPVKLTYNPLFQLFLPLFPLSQISGSIWFGSKRPFPLMPSASTHLPVSGRRHSVLWEGIIFGDWFQLLPSAFSTQTPWHFPINWICPDFFSILPWKKWPQLPGPVISLSFFRPSECQPLCGVWDFLGEFCVVPTGRPLEVAKGWWQQRDGESQQALETLRMGKTK
jgi:hypothetical protein